MTWLDAWLAGGPRGWNFPSAGPVDRAFLSVVERMIDPCQAGRRDTDSAEWPVFAPPVALAPGPLGVVQAGDRADARRIAAEARALAEFAASRPASADRPRVSRGR